MTVQELRPGLGTAPLPTGRVTAALASRRARLAIVSTRNKLCGIAAYTQALERQLAELFDITVFDLDQYLLRGQHQRVRRLGDRHIREICHALGDFDVVNLQLEFGTLGRSARDIYRRFKWIVSAAPRLSVTFHSLKRPPKFSWADFLQAVATFRWVRAYELRSAFVRAHILSEEIARYLRRAQQRKPVNIIVHNRRDLSDARHLYGFRNVGEHPLSFLSSTEIKAIKSEANRHQFPLIDHLSGKEKLVGVFGFLNNYKGFGTVVRALHQLSDEYHLLIFGGMHPNEIQLNQPIHPYIASLLREGHIDASLYEQIAAIPNRGINIAVDMDRHLTELVGVHPRDLSHRIHFMGAVDDADFLAGMAICDVVVLPYLEVGQSSSGPISQAVELGCRVIASRTHNFLEFARYHPDTVEFFDIGNHLELAKRIAARRQYPARCMEARYTTETNKAVYLAANSTPVERPKFRWQRSVARRRHSAAE